MKSRLRQISHQLEVIWIRKSNQSNVAEIRANICNNEHRSLTSKNISLHSGNPCSSITLPFMTNPSAGVASRHWKVRLFAVIFRQVIPLLQPPKSILWESPELVRSAIASVQAGDARSSISKATMIARGFNTRLFNRIQWEWSQRTRSESLCLCVTCSPEICVKISFKWQK